MTGGREAQKPVGEYLVELYVPRRAALDPERLATRARTAAAQLRREGREVRYLRSLVVPDDEMCFHVYAAVSPLDVREAAERVGITAARIVEVIQVPGRRPRKRPPANDQGGRDDE